MDLPLEEPVVVTVAFLGGVRVVTLPALAKRFLNTSAAFLVANLKNTLPPAIARGTKNTAGPAMLLFLYHLTL
jgi:hypothetical protein